MEVMSDLKLHWRKVMEIKMAVTNGVLTSSHLILPMLEKKRRGSPGYREELTLKSEENCIQLKGRG
jgi:hypothetical protein